MNEPLAVVMWLICHFAIHKYQNEIRGARWSHLTFLCSSNGGTKMTLTRCFWLNWHSKVWLCCCVAIDSLRSFSHIRRFSWSRSLFRRNELTPFLPGQVCLLFQRKNLCHSEIRHSPPPPAPPAQASRSHKSSSTTYTNLSSSSSPSESRTR